jgi:lipopolysaccharide/colanic/teichoic acid biosynthesis glycosyltransferase
MSRSGNEYLSGPTKRSLDVVGGAALALALLPAAAISGIIAGIDNRSLNPFFRQVRVGRGGQALEVTKFRTIPQSDLSERPELFGTYDPRASMAGLAMREMGADEIPQLVSVLKGDMSLVGLRPLLQETLDDLENASPSLFKKWRPYYDEFRHGLTGPSQILRHHYRELDGGVLREVMEMDLGYVKHASLRNDLRILGSTPLKLLNARMNIIEPSQSAPPEAPAYSAT